MSDSNDMFDTLLTTIKRIAQEVAAIHANDVDKNGRFPIETVTALKKAQILSAPIPTAFGGAGCSMFQLGQLCAILAGSCGSSGMVLAMHYNQVASVIRHVGDSDFFKAYLSEIVEKQLLLASITSEVGTFGDTRASICAIERQNGRFALRKEATTGSYCAYADDIFVTCRTHLDAPASEQLLVLVRKDDITLTQTTTWDTMGMRGTCSPGFSLIATGDEAQILPCPFASIAAQTMVPYSHILWSALWWGIAADAVAKASAYVRSIARKTPGIVPPAANRLAEVSVQLQFMHHNWLVLANEFDDIYSQPNSIERLEHLGWSLKMNNLKMGMSDLAPKIVHEALQIIGIMAYKNDGSYSLGRHYRDVLSASLMISNDRVASKSAALLLVFKDA